MQRLQPGRLLLVCLLLFYQRRSRARWAPGHFTFTELALLVIQMTARRFICIRFIILPGNPLFNFLLQCRFKLINNQVKPGGRLKCAAEKQPGLGNIPPKQTCLHGFFRVYILAQMFFRAACIAFICLPVCVSPHLFSRSPLKMF